MAVNSSWEVGSVQILRQGSRRENVAEAIEQQSARLNFFGHPCTLDEAHLLFYKVDQYRFVDERCERVFDGLSSKFRTFLALMEGCWWKKDVREESLAGLVQNYLFLKS
jgi:hypothetical protein